MMKIRQCRRLLLLLLRALYHLVNLNFTGRVSNLPLDQSYISRVLKTDDDDDVIKPGKIRIEPEKTCAEHDERRKLKSADE